jgi:hypothetical protein|eukprot:COSAG01_NODE_15853_length_1292_cov_1.264040_2_plen_96_part_00
MCYLGRYAWDRPASAAPSAHVTLFGVANGPTRWGNVSFGIGPQVAGVVLARIAVDFRVPAGAVVHPPTLQVYYIIMIRTAAVAEIHLRFYPSHLR